MSNGGPLFFPNLPSHAGNPPGPPSIDQSEPWFVPEMEAHVYPRADIMNDPQTVAEGLFPTTSATLMVQAWWSGRTKKNVLGDADGLPTPYASREDHILGVLNYSGVAAQFQRRSANLEGGIPSGVRTSDLAGRFAAYLQQVQGHLLGSP